MSQYDHVVVGAGIVGSCTALYLAKAGKKVLLLEQFSLPHTRGSSHGLSRLVRSSYAEPHFASIMGEALDAWKEIERASATNIIVRTGVLCLTNGSSIESFDAMKSNMLKMYPDDITELLMDQVASIYPAFQYPSDYHAFLDKSGGVILANKALTSVQNLFKQHGGQIWDGCSVNKIEPGSDIKVVTSRGFVIAPSVVVCAGAWTKELLTPLYPSLPLQATAVKVYYWKERNPGQHSLSSGFPSFLDCSESLNSIYGLTAVEYPGLVKVCIHGGVPCKPDEREKAKQNVELEQTLRRYVAEHLPGLEPEPAIIETCMYTMTPDEDFIVDVLPENKNIVVGCGFSGTGFKTSPVIGRLLGELALGVTPSRDLTPFSLARPSCAPPKS